MTPAQSRDRLPSYAVFACFLAAAGLPIYIHAPKFYVDQYGVSLATLGTVLFLLRVLDVVQDPLFGRWAARLKHRRTGVATGAIVVMASGMIGLFAIAPPVHPLIWFAAMLTLVFSAFSFLTILFYARGVAKAGELSGQSTNGHVRLARWRETGALIGVCAASVTPAVMIGLGVAPFTGFAVCFAILAAVAWVVMRPEWQAEQRFEHGGFGPVLRDRITRRLLLVALTNAAPVAVSSTLFLFFVESRIAAPGWEGPLLLVFFLSAALAAPFWGRLALAVGAKRALQLGMILSIVAFSFALTLGAGDITAFAIICIASGAALGADMTLLPAIFATRLEKIAPAASEGFALWSFVSKFTLAFAALVLLPLLDFSGFQAGAANRDSALTTLTLLYALVPCILKCVALALLATTPLEEV